MFNTVRILSKKCHLRHNTKERDITKGQQSRFHTYLMSSFIPNQTLKISSLWGLVSSQRKIFIIIKNYKSQECCFIFLYCFLQNTNIASVLFPMLNVCNILLTKLEKPLTRIGNFQTQFQTHKRDLFTCTCFKMTSKLPKFMKDFRTPRVKFFEEHILLSLLLL